MGGGDSSGVLVLLVSVASALILCLASSACGMLVVKKNPGVTTWFQDLLDPPPPTPPPAEAQTSPMAGQWVCADWQGHGVARGFNLVADDAGGGMWCQHPLPNGDPLIANHHRASKLPPDATVGQVYTPDELEKAGGVYGPKAGGFGKSSSERKLFQFTAPGAA